MQAPKEGMKIWNLQLQDHEVKAEIILGEMQLHMKEQDTIIVDQLVMSSSAAKNV